MNQGFGAPKKPNYQLYGVLALIVCLCCCSSSMMSYYRVSIRPSGNMLQGHAGGGWWGRSGGIGDPRGRPKQTIAQCRAYASERGYAGTGYRTDAHPSAPWRNTCFFYNKPNGGKGWQGNDKDLAHKVGCTDPGKSWGNC
jgi:hypothetical protein